MEVSSEEILGQGSFGKVYTRRSGSGVCARKMLAPSSDGITQETARELHALFLMKGIKYIVPVLQVNIDITRHGKTFISIDFKQYTSDLYKFIKKVNFRERLRYAEEIISQLLAGLHALYQRGIIHRDIKPENILVDYSYDTQINKLVTTPKCVIADLGFSRQLSCTHHEDQTRMSATVYSPWYRPPEIVMSSDREIFYSFNSDIWAMGVTLAEYYAGSPLYPVKYHTNDNMLSAIRKSLTPNAENVDLKTFYMRQLHRYHFNLIPSDAISKVERMLTYDFRTRPSIDKIISNGRIIPTSSARLKRGELLIDDKLYHDLIVKIFDISDRYKFEPVTIINTIGILERYLANYHPKDEKMIPLILVVSISLSTLMNEAQSLTMTDYYEMSDQKYEIQAIKEAQVIIASNLGYCFSTCDVDVFILAVLDQPKPTLSLKNTYFGLMADSQRPQIMTYHDLAAAVSKYY